MSEKKETKTNGGSYEVLRNVKLDGKEYVPGDKISMKKTEAEPLIVGGAIGGSGSYKKSVAEAEVVSLGDSKAIKELVDDLKGTIQDQKHVIQRQQEQLAKK